ncbi:hypothetical protein TRVA0_033S00540 [Trichomonascus vanleenenianus]|uniref:uncharacterized protein n=1 Tax=Trichomonascus vanleenenianus TaxID=2268995 RepID=UPI003ECA147E
MRQEFVNTAPTVRIVGKVQSLHGDKCVLDASGEVEVDLIRDANFEIGRFYEVVGKINQDLSIKMLSATDFGTDFDIAALDRALNYYHKNKEIFYA